MRESIGGSWLFTIVIVFLLLFTGYICLAINYSRAYKVKNEVVDIIERDKGLKDISIEEISDYLRTAGYYSTGTCSSDMVAYDLKDVKAKGFTTMGNEGNYCIKSVQINNSSDGGITKEYYQVKLFFKFDIPIFGDIFSFSVSGDTEQL